MARKKKTVVSDSNIDAADENEIVYNDEFYVEKIVDKIFNNEGIAEFLIKWHGYEEKDNTWVQEKMFFVQIYLRITNPSPKRMVRKRKQLSMRFADYPLV